MLNKDLPKLLRAIANSENAKADRHDVILNAAADELDYWRNLMDKALAKNKAEFQELMPTVKLE